MQFVNLAAEAKINPLIPHTAELVVGAIAFTLLFLTLRKFVVPMFEKAYACLLYTSPSPRDGLLSRMPSSA